MICLFEGEHMQSETIGALAAALAKAQGAIKPATKDNTVKTNTYNYSYATLSQLWEVAREALSANGLAVTQTTDIGNSGEIILLTTLLHTSGEWVGGVYPVRAKDNMPQSLGSAMTYARRYALSAMLGLTADDDDDGNAASAPAPNRAPVKAQNGGGGHTPPVTVSKQPNNLRNESIETADSHSTGTTDNPFVTEEAHLLKKLNAVGGDLYGNQWTDDKRHDLAEKITKGRTRSSKQMTAQELESLIAWMSGKIEERKRQAVPA